MEPIRPDDDDLRAERPVGSSQKKAPAQKKPKPSADGSVDQPKPPKPAKGGKSNSGGGGGGSSLAVLWLLVLVVAVASVAGWYFQNQQIQMLE
ncbi:MAG: hypothetical protein ACTJG6_16465, partial [Marinobacter sp.]